MGLDNQPFIRAKRSQNDEFYTMASTIEAEVPLYAESLVNRRVYCNCDDPRHSKFWEHFVSNFEKYRLSGVVATHLTDTKGQVWFYDGTKVETAPIGGSGRFESDECLSILDAVDVVITNPPFSLLKSFIPLMFRAKKDFLIIGTIRALTYISTRDFYLQGHLHLGSPHNIGLSFETESGVKKIGYSCWLTNIKHDREPPPIRLNTAYPHINHPRIDNCGILYVDKVSNIPAGYDGVMAVPLSFATKHNKGQFALLDYIHEPMVKGESKFARILIQRKG